MTVEETIAAVARYLDMPVEELIAACERFCVEFVIYQSAETRVHWDTRTFMDPEVQP